MRVTSLILALSVALFASAAQGAPTVAKKKSVAVQKVAIDAKLVQAVLKARGQAKSTRSTLKLAAKDEALAVKHYKSLSAPQRLALARIAGKILDSAVQNGGKLSPKLGEAIRGDLKLFAKTDVRVLAIASYRLSVELAADRLESAAKKLDDQRTRVKRLRESIAHLREVIADWGNAASQSVSWTEANGQTVTQTLTLSGTQAVIERLDTELKTASDLTEMFKLDLQQALQDQSRAHALLSAILKSQHETLKSIIQNMK